jgi:predicted nucleic acid-binding protein
LRIFLDTSFIIAAAGSDKGLPRFIFEHGRRCGWEFVTSLYCEEEVNRNISKVDGSAFWLAGIRPHLVIHATEIVLDYPLVFEATKDRPVIISALGSQATYLLTLDHGDFATLLETEVYGMRVRLPLPFAREMALRPSEGGTPPTIRAAPRRGR